MLDWRLASTRFILAVTLILWISGKVLSVDVTTTEDFDSGVINVQSPPTVTEEKTATDLTAKLLLLDELVSLENDVTETKKKRSFSGFGSPLDRLSAGSVDHKGKQRYSDVVTGSQDGAQHPHPVDVPEVPGLPGPRNGKEALAERKAVDHPKRRLGIPMDRIGRNRLSNSRG
uniref:Osteocrin n=1 Tax=Callithrix jacchus TaxID=9483 RepID=A0A5F4WKX3_CALJA|nr:osteocrin isoform X1 [Callithrix jacchus]